MTLVYSHNFMNVHCRITPKDMPRFVSAIAWPWPGYRHVVFMIRSLFFIIVQGVCGAFNSKRAPL
ncbi:uncharacterized protein M421DRAFT_192142 [Didymella exigua CBS 183.55]|uniref:Uncharacterized protein n=1 Tax=Didymella exigua CBS 183.55 TaxID=1150837 RepID=A0A6A5RZD6_9PLEO|nr:uncharacterized protein M421DRAFT_192142 [Didymella exigua CBS 183.55]KAF1933222.1 hypothetical protein M421DRAFT_192142 [Didymella exigua CBS 183.55]